MAETQTRLERGDELEWVIEQALARGLSWRTITDLLVEHDGQPRSTAGVHKRYRYLVRG